MEPQNLTPLDESRQNFRKGIFISYSHEDEFWLKRLMDFLKPLIREDVHVWNDTMIPAGSDWKKAIEDAIYHSRVAVLLVSQNFIASEFIYREELPYILENTSRGLTVIWIAVGYSMFLQTPLAQFQAGNDPARPLQSLSDADRDKVLVDIANKIASAVDLNATANAFHIIDRFYPEQEAFTEGREESGLPQPGTVAVQQQTTIHFERRDFGVVEQITAKDIEKLDDESRQLIRAFEATMKDLFDRWTELKPKRVARDEQVREKARRESDEIRQDLCAELNGLLDFIATLGKYLEDHYYHVRFICKQPASVK